MRNSLFALAGIILSCCSLRAAEEVTCPAPVTSMEMQKGEYSPVPGVVFNLQNFVAVMVARGKQLPLCMARTANIQHGQVSMSDASLTKIFAQKLGQTDSSIKDMAISASGEGIKLTGKVHKGIDLPFDIEGPLSTDGKLLILHATKIKAEGIPVKGLLGLVGKNLASLFNPGPGSGVLVKENTLIFDPLELAHVRGRIQSARSVAHGLVLNFAPEATAVTAKSNLPR